MVHYQKDACINVSESRKSSAQYAQERAHDCPAPFPWNKRIHFLSRCRVFPSLTMLTVVQLQEGWKRVKNVEILDQEELNLQSVIDSQHDRNLEHQPMRQRR